MGTAVRTHRHDEFHRSVVPVGQLGLSVPGTGDVLTATSGTTADWVTPTSGGGSGSSGCEHQHHTDTFSAGGASPETFTLSFEPLGWRRVFLQGLRVGYASISGAGTEVKFDTTASDEVLIDYERACGSLGVIQDGDPVSFKTLGWYVWGLVVDFANQVPVAWAEQTLYRPGEIIVESGWLFARYPNTSRLSDVIANKPDFGSVAEGDYVSDLGGYWQRLPDAFDVTAALSAWAATTNFNYGLLGDDCIYLAPGNGYVYCAEFLNSTIETGAVEPIWPADPCGGGGSFYVDFGDLILARAYVPLSVTATLNGTPIDSNDLVESEPAEGIVLFTGSASPEDVIVVSSAAVC